jgi:hypothetical protein
VRKIVGGVLLIGMMLWSTADDGPRNPSAFARGAMWGIGIVLYLGSREDWR